MGSQTQNGLTSSLPVYTLLILAVSGLAYVLPPVASSLIFDRSAILDGEVWRILSGHAVHFSSTHFVYDLLAFGIAGFVIEYKRYPNCGLLYLLMALAIGVSLLICRPAMYYYGGLSGLACGAMVYLALPGLHDTPSMRLISASMLVLVVVKIGFELYSGQSVLQEGRAAAFIPMPLSHLVGGVVAVLLYIVERSPAPRRQAH